MFAKIKTKTSVLPVLIVVLLSGILTGQPGYLITGKVNLSEDWAPVVYLSIVATLDDLTAASEDMIFNSAAISSTGEFRLSGEFLPEGNRIYRLHVSQEGDPASTIFIGGKDQNHVHFTMRPGDTVRIDQAIPGRFSSCRVEGDEANNCLQDVDRIMHEFRNRRASSAAAVSIKREETRALLQRVIDQCRFPTGRLYAAHYMIERFNDDSVTDAVFDLLGTKKIETSPYYHSMAQRVGLPVLEDRPSRTDRRWWALLLLIPALLVLWRQQVAKVPTEPASVSLDELSVQERRVFELLLDGRTNKEISRNLNIGVSTVKSHVHRIYKKLGISSRREVMSLKNRVQV